MLGFAGCLFFQKIIFSKIPPGGSTKCRTICFNYILTPKMSKSKLFTLLTPKMSKSKLFTLLIPKMSKPLMSHNSTHKAFHIVLVCLQNTSMLRRFFFQFAYFFKNSPRRAGYTMKFTYFFKKSPRRATWPMTFMLFFENSRWRPN